MSTSIREVVESTLSNQGYSSYLHYAGPTITALEERERGIYNDLVAKGIGLGASQADVEEILDAAGVTAPARPDEDLELVDLDSLNQADRDELASIRHDLSGLMERIDKVLG